MYSHIEYFICIVTVPAPAQLHTHCQSLHVLFELCTGHAVSHHKTYSFSVTLSVPSRPSPIPHDIDSKPTLQDLERFVVRQAASKWELLARSLGVQESLVSIVKRDKYYSCEEACREILKRWLNGERYTGGTVRSWQSIMTALEEIGETG